MKKSLIALAALAATASFAQSTVTLSGVIDYAYANASGNVVGNTITTNLGTSATSVIRIDAVEDLGGGMKAVARYALDPRTLANDSYTVASTVQGLQALNSGLARDEAYVGINGAFGDIKLGSPNSIGLTSYLGASALGTGIGSGYAPFSGTMTMTFSGIRYNRSVRYDSPNMNGFTASVLYVPGGDNTLSSTAIELIPNNRSVTELGLRYVNGPLNVSYVNIAQKAQTANGGWATGILENTTSIANKAKTSVNILNAAYKIDNTTLMAGWNDGDALNGSAAEGYRLAARQDIGAISLMAQYTVQKRGTVEAKVTGLRADYNLSKRTAAYIGYEKWDTGTALDVTDLAKSVTTGDRKLTSIGVRHSF